ncbi:MAG: IMP dehydrogenase, partial [Candidatus Woesebacteria bacterium]|nr:IMP dehydrogenase [Candidatus Woesebacteria bacterium]
GKKFKVYNASTSLTEKVNHSKLNKDEVEIHYIKQIEGVESIVPYKGPLKDIVERITANLRSGFSYSGAKDINYLWKNSSFVQITPQGLRESGAHDVLLYNTN